MRTADAAHGNKPIDPKGLSILIYDVESSPNIGFTWGRREQDVIQFVEERQIMSFAWKWLGEKDVHVLALPHFKGYKKNKRDNTALIKRLHELISRADVAVAHNGDAFDDKMANTDFILHDLPPPPPHKCVDTLKIARSRFRFNSNKLDDLGERLGLGRKVKHPGFSMWLGCLNGDPKSWEQMTKYNVGDVELLEKIYLKLRPWMKSHPDVNSIDGHVGCSVCRSTHVQMRGWESVGGSRRRRYQCMDCGKWLRGSTTKIEKYR